MQLTDKKRFIVVFHNGHLFEGMCLHIFAKSKQYADELVFNYFNGGWVKRPYIIYDSNDIHLYYNEPIERVTFKHGNNVIIYESINAIKTNIKYAYEEPYRV